MSAAATPKAKKAAKQKKPAAHPSYIIMIKTAIAAMKERGGSSRPKIKKYIVQNNKDVRPEQIKVAIRRGVSSGEIVQNKGKFKLPASAEKKKPKAKKPKADKPKKPAKAKKTGEKKAKSPAKKTKKPKTPKKKPAAPKAAKAKKAKSPAKKAAKSKVKKPAKKSVKKAAKK